MKNPENDSSIRPEKKKAAALGALDGRVLPIIRATLLAVIAALSNGDTGMTRTSANDLNARAVSDGDNDAPLIPVEKADPYMRERKKISEMLDPEILYLIYRPSDEEQKRRNEPVQL